MFRSSRLLTIFLIFILPLPFVAAELRGKDLEMHEEAMSRYLEANMDTGQGFQPIENLDSKQEKAWRRELRGEMLAEAELRGGMHVGARRDFLGRKVTYFSTFIRPDASNQISRHMELHQPSFILNGLHQKEAAIFWKHIGRSYKPNNAKPLQIVLLGSHEANYGLETLTNIVRKDLLRISPHSGHWRLEAPVCSF